MFDFEIYVDAAGKFRWRMVGKNNETLGDNYNRLQSAKETIALIKAGAANAEVYLELDGVRTKADDV